ncbi:nucleotidyltransferase [Sphingomonas floccifaciens]|uniref:Nucleotidyltransferase n=1 Tax=Sphingomonas floccifaciens TaxID=1844115 RepID=A0ABW4NDI2_9SPHN
MMRFTEDQLARWAAPPSQTERDRMDNAERAVRNAIAASDALKARTVSVFAQGSYRNRVNVRQDSDVDVAVLCTDTFFWEGPPGATLHSLGYVDATYHFPDFRREVGEALASHFGSGVTPGDKAFDIKANSYRVDADVAPFFEHRRFDGAGSYLRGAEMWTRSGARTINWPEQHYANAVAKNDATGRSFKGCVRILKTLRYAMLADGVASAAATTSFLVECLVWNVPNDQFGNATWASDIRHCLAFLYNNTRSHEDCGQWGEVSELKYLFHGQQPWTWQGAHSFVADCWDYLGFEP